MRYATDTSASLYHIAGCRFGNGTAVALADVNSLCSSMSPSVQEACAPCTFCSDPAQNFNCSNRGSCSNGACVCVAPFGGPICAVDTTDCASGVTDSSATCCDSGVVDIVGTCCVQSGGLEPVLTRTGVCCPSGVVDACGECDGPAKVVDAVGRCCPVRFNVKASG